MSNTRARHCLLAITLIVAFAAGCAQRTLQDPPRMMREYRAAWVTTATNIDWPSQRMLSKDEQIQEIEQILNRAEELKLNVLIVQVRSAANRLYASSLPHAEPWARAISPTGKQGVDPGYDPLKEWVDRAHAHGIELHAWVNPFRANGATKYPTTVPLGKEGWFNPGEPDVKQWNRQIIQELLTPTTQDFVDADIDGIAYDHYFYTDPDDDGDGTTRPAAPVTTSRPTGSVWDKHDESTYNQHNNGRESWEDFRRRQIDEFIQDTHNLIDNSDKPWVKFGISPMAIFDPGHLHDGHKDQYDKNYANPKKWLNAGWCDYVVPELYWTLNNPKWGFKKYLDFWLSENQTHRHVVAGMRTTKIPWPWEAPNGWTAKEIVDQIKATRKTKAVGGAHFSMRVLDQNRGGICDLLMSEVYSEPALVPPITWKSPTTAVNAPANPTYARLTREQMQAAMRKVANNLESTPKTKPVLIKPFYALKSPPPIAPTGGVRINLRPAKGQKVWLWAVYARQGDKWVKQIVSGSKTEAIIPEGDNRTDEVAVSVVNRYGVESPFAKIGVR